MPVLTLQDPSGYVRLATRNNGPNKPGQLQSQTEPGTCAGVDPYSNSEIKQMIEYGVGGTSAGDALATNLIQGEDKVGQPDTACGVYDAARTCNSGDVDLDRLERSEGAISCYICEIANRLP